MDAQNLPKSLECPFCTIIISDFSLETAQKRLEQHANEHFQDDIKIDENSDYDVEIIAINGVKVVEGEKKSVGNSKVEKQATESDGFSKADKTSVQSLIQNTMKPSTSQANPLSFFERIKAMLNSPTSYKLATPNGLRHIHQDSQWDCGYRNIQMMLSQLLVHPNCSNLSDTLQGLIGTNTPSVSQLQILIEMAWQAGHDQQGALQLDNRLQGTRKWIGATELCALLDFLNVGNELIDFHCYTGTKGSDRLGHVRLMDWVDTYFQCLDKPLLYFQHQGHSVSIIGIEYGKTNQPGLDGRALICLCPGTSPSSRTLRIYADPYARMSHEAAKKLPKKYQLAAHHQYQIVKANPQASSPTKIPKRYTLTSTRIP